LRVSSAPARERAICRIGKPDGIGFHTAGAGRPPGGEDSRRQRVAGPPPRGASLHVGIGVGRTPGPRNHARARGSRRPRRGVGRWCCAAASGRRRGRARGRGGSDRLGLRSGACAHVTLMRPTAGLRFGVWLGGAASRRAGQVRVVLGVAASSDANAGRPRRLP
jgi:hypothetical protein